MKLQQGGQGHRSEENGDPKVASLGHELPFI
jgi:hypothetical protein